MFKSDFEILERIHHYSNGIPADHLYRFIGNDHADRVQALIDDGLVEISNSVPSKFGWSSVASEFRLTPQGVRTLHEQLLSQNRAAEQEAKRERENEENRSHTAQENRKNRRHDYFVAIFSSLLSFAVGLVLEYKYQIITFIVELVKK